ncbi:DNA-binding transcription factor CAT8 [Sugiyamaella lignohabitans]|uniref:DNA-binding transcription factor CAT8 n=1 Tax=Sugiyamaella lignohabitans TaxID=796027 RepID=A0A167FC93_9ASCO|nr:DNA-binding transcription factor CAT8 [Sugiyamaella lignohabitans]ANB15106.1 DNA-binding transcription factor CAT8 [Sugiyamaella lignohabitans]
MPDGAQAWKMIKTPGTHTDRIAQACDRCRSKKIRCDGLRPHCSQCLAVGFECKISDKLTRRAFPRGYTESLEDRIRQLESENSRLSNLLDVKDEQMEMLSRVEAVHDSSPRGSVSGASGNQSAAVSAKSNISSINNALPSSLGGSSQQHTQKNLSYVSTLIPEKDDSSSSASPQSPDENNNAIFINHANELGADGTYRGTSAGGVFISSFVQKLKVKNPEILPPVQQIATAFSQTTDGGIVRSALKISSPSSSYSNGGGSLLSPASSSSELSSSGFSSLFPSRLSCDKLVTVYFQEWQSVYAILDQSRFLSDYQTFFDDIDDDSKPGNDLQAATLALVLILACLANKEGTALTTEEVWKLDSLWKRIMSNRHKPTLGLLQAASLAQLYSLYAGNLDDVWFYRSIMTSTAQRLGLHRSRKAMHHANGKPLSAYESELGRRVFWATYTLDVFSSAVLGSPRLYNDSQIQCSMPKYIDEDVVTDSLVTPPPSSPESVDGATTKDSLPASCQVSVIQFSRLLAEILDTVYSTNTTVQRSRTVLMLEDKLESWHRELPPSLKFEFVNGLPTATLCPVHQKSPLLLMLYHYAKLLIHLPATADFANTSTSGSIVAVTQSAKTYIQIFNYLKARNVSSTLPLSPTRMMLFLGTVVLFCAMDYSKGGALLQQSRKLVSQGLGFLYNDMQAGLPGSITAECFQWLEEICDSVLNGGPSQRKSSTSNGSSKQKSESRSRSQEKQSQKQRNSPQQQQHPQQQHHQQLYSQHHSHQPDNQYPHHRQKQHQEPHNASHRSSHKSSLPARIKLEPSPTDTPTVESPSYQQIIIPQQPNIDSSTSAMLATATLMGVPFQLSENQSEDLSAYRFNPHDYQQQVPNVHPVPAQTAYYAPENMNTSINSIGTSSPTDDFFDTSSFEDFDINSVLGQNTVKQEQSASGVPTVTTNTFLENFNWDDSYNWSTMTV